jgi:hypothetical protein
VPLVYCRKYDHIVDIFTNSLIQAKYVKNEVMIGI